MSEDEKPSFSLDEIADWVQQYGNGFEAVTEGLSTSHHASFRFDDGAEHTEPLGSAIRPDLDAVIDGLKEKFSTIEALPMRDKMAAMAAMEPFSREWYELKMIATREAFRMMSSAAETDDDRIGVTMAFQFGLELGAFFKEYEWKFGHEKAALEGHRHMEGRAVGQPMGAQANRNIGNKHRGAIIAAAKRLVAENRAFARNLSELARVIESEKLAALRQKDGSYLGDSAIRSHLKAARKSGEID